MLPAKMQHLRYFTPTRAYSALRSTSRLQPLIASQRPRFLTSQSHPLSAAAHAPASTPPAPNPADVSENTTNDPKSFPAPPPYQRHTPDWLRNNPTFVKVVRGLARMLGHRTKTVTAIRETRWMYNACAEREVAETGFIYVECKLPATFQTWFQFTNMHIWLLTTRFRGLPPPYGRLYSQELVNHFFLDVEYRLRSVFSHKVPERIIKNHMADLRDQWNGTTASYDIALMQGDTELAGCIWRNVFGARGEKAYKEKDISSEEREQRIAKRMQNNDPETAGTALEDLPRLLYLYTAHVRRELKRLEGLSDADVLAGNLGVFGTVGGKQGDTAVLELKANKSLEDSDATAS